MFQELSPRWLKVLHDLKGNLSRTLLSVASIAVGVIAFGGMLIGRNAVVTNLDAAYHSSVPADIMIDMAPFDHELLRWVMNQPGVRQVDSLSIVNGVVELADGTEQDITIFGRDNYSSIALNRLKPVTGAYPPPHGGFSMERMSARNAVLQTGEQVSIRLQTDKTYVLRYTGSLYDVNAQSVGPSATRWNLYVDERTLSDLDVAARPTRLMIQMAPGSDSAQKYALAEQLSDALGKRGLTVRAITVNDRGEHWAAATAGGIIFILVLVGAVALLMSGFLIVNVVNGLLLSQKKIIAIMKIVGGDRWQIAGVYLVMMTCLGMLALVVALPTSIVLGNIVAGFIAGIINFDLVVSGFTPTIALLEVSVALLVPIAFAYGPIHSALRVTAAEAISDVAPRQKASLTERLLARLENLPRVVTLAVRSMFRNQMRLFVTMATLVVAGGVFIAVLNLRIAMPQTITKMVGVNTADVTLILGRPIGRIAAINRAVQTSGVAYAEGWMATSATVVRVEGDGSTVQMNAGPADSRFVQPPMDSGHWLSPYSAETRDEIVLSIGLLENEPGLELGDAIVLRRAGVEHTFRIVGFLRRIGGPESSVFPAYGHFETVGRLAGGVGTVTSVRVRAASMDAAFIEQMSTALRSSFEDVGISVVNLQNRATTLDDALSSFDVIITLMIGVAALIALVGGLGLAGTMSLSVMERTREIGVMRAVGAETPDLRTMFIVEGLFIGLLSALISFVLSIPLTDLIGRALGSAVRLGTIEVLVNQTGYGLWLLIVSVVSVVASIAPARRAGKISIREALAYA